MLSVAARFNKLLSLSVIFNFVFDQLAGLVVLFSRYSLTAVNAYCLCAACVVRGHCLTVIQLCSLYLDCQVMSVRADDPFTSLKYIRDNKNQAHISL